MVSPRILLFLVFLEGYAVLSLELLAIRQSINFIGSNTDKISFIIAAVLIPLAIGYYVGGKYRPRQDEEGRLVTIRDRLQNNIDIAVILMTAGLSYIPLNIFFTTLYSFFGMSHLYVLATIYSFIFVFTPCYFLAQSVPLLSNYFRRGQAAELTGRIFFISTLGSFMGSVFCTLVLMRYFGVNFAVPVTIGALLVLTFILSKKPFTRHTVIAAACFMIAVFLNHPRMLVHLDIVEQNPYNTLAVLNPEEGTRILLVNNTLSSKLSAGPERKFRYIEFAEEHFIAPVLETGPAKNILVIGSGGFTLGLEDSKNKYTYVDIDPSMRRVAEQYFLQRPLLPNKNFIPLPARGFLARTQEKYDMIFMDVAFGLFTVPEHLLTREYLVSIREALTEDGVFVMNFLGTANFSNALAYRFDNTFRSVFSHISRQPLYGYNPWERSNRLEMNVIYTGYQERGVP